MKRSVRIVGRFDKASGIGHHGWSFLEILESIDEIALQVVLTNKRLDRDTIKEIQSKKVTVCFYDELVGTADFSIYCDVLGQEPEGFSLSGLGDINIAYCVFDSTRIPESWVKTLNNYFDLVVTPSEFVKRALQVSGVERDVLTLPLTVCDSSKFVAAQPEGKPVTFGFIGSYEKRKNVELLLESFLDAFPNGEANLRVHLSYSHESKQQLMRLVNRFAVSNIEITLGKISQEALFTLYEQFDCYVSLSMGEGFSLTVREFMHFGKPIILSDTAAHAELPPLNGLYFIPASIPHPAHYPQIDGKIHGHFLSPYKPDVIYALKKLVSEIVKSELFPDLQNYVKTLTPDALRSTYQTIFIPKNIIRSVRSNIDLESTLVLSSEGLIKKYHEKHGVEFERVAPTKQVVLANDGGFFSVFNRFISMLTWECTLNPAMIVIPDWRVDAMIDYYGHNKFTSFCYGRLEDENIFFKLFKPLAFPQVEPTFYNDEVWLRENATVRTDHNEKHEPNLTYMHAYKLYKGKDFKKWREWYHSYFSKHIHLNATLEGFIQSFRKKHFEGCHIIAAHVRHPSHSIEQPSGRLPTVALFQKIIDREIAKSKREHALPIKVFIATDQASVIQFFEKVYGVDLIKVDVTRTNLEHDKVFNGLSKSEKKQEGFQIQHIMASDQSSWSLRMAEEVIIDAWLLASANKFIHTTSNISTAVSFINPEIEMIYCE